MRRASTIAAGVIAATAIVVPAAGAAAAQPVAHAAKTTTVTVTASEFKFKLSKTTVPKGAVTFKVKNAGSVAHDFKIDGKKTASLNPGKSATLKVTFKKAGKYPYLCTITGHAAAGMKGTLTVK